MLEYMQGVLSSVVPQLRQVFERIGSGAGAGSGGVAGVRTPADARFQHFCAAVWPRLQSSGASGMSALEPEIYMPMQLSSAQQCGRGPGPAAFVGRVLHSAT